MKTATEQAMDLIKRWTVVAAQDNTPAGGYGIKVSPKGRYSHSESLDRVGYEAAVQFVANAINESAVPSTTKAATNMSWDKLNQATQAFFFQICGDMIKASEDAGFSQAVNQKSLSIGLVNAPRLSNLKKAGLIVMINGATKSVKMLQLTEEGKAIFSNQS